MKPCNLVFFITFSGENSDFLNRVFNNCAFKDLNVKNPFLHAFDGVCAIFVKSFNASWVNFLSFEASPPNFREHIILVLSPEADKKRCLQCVQCQQIRERFEDKWILRAAADFVDFESSRRFWRFSRRGQNQHSWESL